MQLELTLGDGPLYSLDTSALIDVKDLYPIEVFPSMWQFIGRLAEAKRVFVAEAVKDECYDDEIIEILKTYPNMIIDFGLLQAHFAALMAEAEKNQLLLVNPSAVRNAADPHVIAVALVSDFYGLEHVSWLDLLRREGFSV
jgi:hypothetical protein